LYARRIAPPPPRGLGGNPERKNTPCISDLAGVKFPLEKERVFFFRGSALQVFGQVECRMQFGRGKAKLFLREEKDLLCLGSFFRTAGFEFPPCRKVREECAADSFLIFEQGVAKRKNLFESKLLLRDYSK